MDALVVFPTGRVSVAAGWPNAGVATVVNATHNRKSHGRARMISSRFEFAAAECSRSPCSGASKAAACPEKEATWRQFPFGVDSGREGRPMSNDTKKPRRLFSIDPA